MTADAHPRDHAHRRDHDRPPVTDRRWTALIVIAVAPLMTALDATVVNIALPSAQRSLGFGDAGRQWVIAAYTLAFAGLLLLGGRISGRFGRRRSFVAGLGGFAAASALAGAAPGLPLLVAGRALQGAAAALLALTALSLIAVTFTDRRERATAFAVFGAVTSGGAAAGLLAGGVLTEYLRWRWCLHVNVVIAVGAALAGRAVLPDPAHRSPGRIPVADAILITAGLAVVVLDCSRAAPYGWGSARVVVPLACGALAIAAFLIIQAGRPEPLLPQQLLAWTDRTGAYVAVATAVVGSYGLFLMLSYHFQTVLGYSPVRAGLAFLPMTAAVAGGGYAIVRVLPYVRPQTLMATGLLLASAGLVLLSTRGPGSGYLGLILPAELLVGAGMAGMFTPTLNALTYDADPLEAVAVKNTALQVGGSVGVAVLGTIAVTAAHDSLAAHAGPAEALVRDFGTAAGWAALLPACAAAVVLITVRAARPAAHSHP